MDFYDLSSVKEYLLPCHLFKVMFNFRESYCQTDVVDCRPDVLISDQDLLTLARRQPSSRSDFEYLLEFDEDNNKQTELI